MTDRLYRSRDDRMLAGVAGGLAEMWDADPSIIRIVWAVLVFLTGGLALLVYVVMAIVVPLDDRPPGSDAAPEGDRPAASDAAETMVASDVGPGTRRSPRADRRAARRERRDGSAGIVIGGVLIAIGGLFLAQQFMPQISFDWVWPMMLVGLGVVVLAVGLTRDRGEGPGSR